MIYRPLGSIKLAQGFHDICGNTASVCFVAYGLTQTKKSVNRAVCRVEFDSILLSLKITFSKDIVISSVKITRFLILHK